MKRRHLRSSISRCLTLGVFLTGLMALGLAPAHAETVQQTLPYAPPPMTACNGDIVAVMGSINVLSSVTVNGGGGFRIETHLNTQGVSGTGFPSGANYNYEEKDDVTINDVSNSGGQFTASTDRRLNHTGPSGQVADDTYIHIEVHVTVNANGEPTAIVENISGVECR